jgi:hypothetical protein
VNRGQQSEGLEISNELNTAEKERRFRGYFWLRTFVYDLPPAMIIIVKSTIVIAWLLSP